MTKRKAKKDLKHHGMLHRAYTASKVRKRRSPTGWKKWLKRDPEKRDLRCELLREKDRSMLLFIREFQYAYRYSPTRSDICGFFNYSPNQYQRIINRLLKYKYIETAGIARHPQILFPKGTKFPWAETYELSHIIFSPHPDEPDANKK